MIHGIFSLIEKIHSVFIDISTDIQIIKSDLIIIKSFKDPPYLLTSKEAAKLLRVSLRTLHEYRDRGYITYIQKGSKVLFKKSSISEFLNANTIKKGDQ